MLTIGTYAFVYGKQTTVRVLIEPPNSGESAPGRQTDETNWRFSLANKTDLCSGTGRKAQCGWQSYKAPTHGFLAITGKRWYGRRLGP